jgi:uncharacterized FAD-dependent dehydrogenase
MRGFTGAEAVLIGVETRTSSPVRIARGDDFQAVGWRVFIRREKVLDTRAVL